MKTIKLTNGMQALVDDEDYERLNQYVWSVRTIRLANGESAPNLFYVYRVGVDKTYIHMHRVVLNTDQKVDHKNCDGLDNQKENLRLASSLENSRNRRTHRTDKTCPYKGVCMHWHSGLWRAYIKLPEKQLSLGYYKDPVDAAYAYDRAAIKHFGEFARPNFPGGMG